jgi:hypothetical protein
MRLGRARSILLLAAVAALVMGVLIVSNAVAAGPRLGGTAELTEELGLIPHDAPDGTVIRSTPEGVVVNGEILADCSPTASGDAVLLLDMGDFFYCVHGSSDLEAWIIGQRIIGHEPTEAEIEEMRVALADIPPPPEGA